MKPKILSIRKIIKENNKIESVFFRLYKYGYTLKINNKKHPIVKNKILKYELYSFLRRQSFHDYIRKNLFDLNL